MNTSSSKRKSEKTLARRTRVACILIQCFLLISCSCSNALSAPICKIKILPKADNNTQADDSLEQQFSDLRVDMMSGNYYVQKVHLDSNNVLPQVSVTPVDYARSASHNSEQTLRLPASLCPKTAASESVSSEAFRAITKSECMHRPSASKMVAQSVQSGTRKGALWNVAGNKNSPLKVLRKFPTGKVDVVRQISVVFSKPMVPQCEIGQALKAKHLATISPTRPGQWKWADEKTLLFIPNAKNLPQATVYTVCIAAGMAAIDGSRLAQNESWTVVTPAPRVDLSTGDTTNTGEIILLNASQPVKQDSVIAKTHLIADGKTIPVKALSQGKIKQIYGTQFRVGTMLFALCPVSLDELKKAKSAKIVVDAGVLPLEGTIGSQKRSESSVKWAPSNEEIGFLGQRQDYEPLEPWCLWYKGPTDIESVKPEMIDIQPALANMKAYVKDNLLYVSGDSQANTEYSITFKAGIMGRWKRTTEYKPLSRDLTAKVRVRSYSPKFLKPDPCVCIDPQGEKQFPIHSINIHKADVAIYAGDPKLVIDSNFISQTPLFKKTVQLNFKQDECAETLIDLKPFLDGTNHLIVTVKNADTPAKLPQYEAPNFRRKVASEYQCWVQSTNLNLSIVTSTHKVFCLVANRKTGKPIANAKVEIIAVSNDIASKVKRTRISAITNSDGICEITDFAQRSNFGAVSASTTSDRVMIASRRIMMIAPAGADSKALTYKWVSSFERPVVQRLTDVSFCGWVREVSQDLLNIPSNCELKYEVLDSQHQLIANGKSVLTPSGGFQGRIRVPENTSCGVCSLNATLLRGGVEIDKQEMVGAFEIGEATPEPAIKMELNPEAIPVLRVNDLVTTSAQLKTREGNPIRNHDVSWRAWLSQSNWSPPGWKNLTFAQEVSPDCPQFQTVPLHNQITIKSDENGYSAVSTCYKAELTTPAVMIVEATTSNPTTARIVNYQAMPSNALVGISRAIKQTGNEQLVDINYLVCDLKGKPVAGRTVKLSINDVISGTKLFEESVVSSESLQQIHANVKGLNPINVIAEVSDEENHVHKANILSQTNRTKAQNNADRKVSLRVGMEGYNSTDNYAALISPFSNSKGIFVTNSSSNSTCTVVETNGKPVTENFQIATRPYETEVFAKLYNTDMKTPGHLEAALGDCFVDAVEIPQMSISLESTNKNILAGTVAEIKIEARNPDGGPASNAEFVLAGTESGSGLGPSENQFFNDMQYPSKNFTNITAVSTDRMKASLTEEEARKVFLLQMSKIHNPDENSGCRSGYYSPEPTSEAVENTATRILTTDENGCATASLAIPPNSKNYKIVALVASGKNQFGSASLTLPCSQPLTVTALNPTYIYDKDTYTLPVCIKNSSTLEVPVTIEAKLKDKVEYIRLGEVKIPPRTESRVLIERANWLGNNFEIKVNSGGNQRILSFDLKSVQAPDIIPRVNLQKQVTVLAALERVATKMQGKPCDSTDQLASRIITSLALKAIKGDTKFSSCCDDITREDVCQLTKLNAETGGWLRWINQLNAFNEYLVTVFPTIQTTLAFSMASDAGINIEAQAIRAVSEKLENLEWGEPTPASSKFKAQMLANYVWSQAINTVQKDEQGWQTALPAQIRVANEKVLQARRIEKLDAQSIALLAMTSKKVGIYPNLQDQINRRLLSLCEQSPIRGNFSESDITLIHCSDVTENAWLLNACCTLNLGSAEKKQQLAQYLLSKLHDGGWKNHVENYTCLLALRSALDAHVIALTDPVLERNSTVTNTPTIERTFAADDATSRVWKDSEGIWHADCGSKIRTSIKLCCFKNDRQFVLNDYIPAGAQPLPQEAPQGWPIDMKHSVDVNFYNNEWFQQLSFDKNQAKVYALEIDPGELSLSYKVRALCPGTYTIPPAHFASVNDDRVVQFSRPDVLIIE